MNAQIVVLGAMKVCTWLATKHILAMHQITSLYMNAVLTPVSDLDLNLYILVMLYIVWLLLTLWFNSIHSSEIYQTTLQFISILLFLELKVPAYVVNLTLNKLYCNSTWELRAMNKLKAKGHFTLGFWGSKSLILNKHNFELSKMGN